MKKFLTFFLLFIFSFSFCTAQDTLVLKNGQKIAAKVAFVSDEQVWYTLPPAEKQLSIWAYKLYYIKYSNGSIYTVSQPETFNKGENVVYTFNDTIHKLFSITTDIAQYFLIQPNLGAEYRLGGTVTLGANFGLVFPSSMFTVNPLANGQFTNPGTVYTGYAFRFFSKFFLSDKERGYFSVQMVYKSIYFNNLSFYDTYGDAYSNTYSLNEKTKTFGFEFIYGIETSGPKNPLDIDFFWGLGLHVRNRNYTIYNQSFGNFGAPPNQYQGEPVAYNGNYTDALTIITPIFGMRVGFNYIKKK